VVIEPCFFHRVELHGATLPKPPGKRREGPDLMGAGPAPSRVDRGARRRCGRASLHRDPDYGEELRELARARSDAAIEDDRPTVIAR
jgi:hypothetical protein